VSRDLIGLRIDDSTMSNNVIGITFDILEPSDGSVIQLIYEGSSNAKIEVSGVIEKQGNVVSWTGSSTPPPPGFGWVILVATIIGLPAVANALGKQWTTITEKHDVPSDIRSRNYPVDKPR
jgi:hypothetical protein